MKTTKRNIIMAAAAIVTGVLTGVGAQVMPGLLNFNAGELPVSEISQRFREVQ